MRVAFLVTHKRITAKTNNRQSIDAHVKPATVLLQHTIQSISFFSSSNLTQGNSFFHVGRNCHLGLHIFSRSHCQDVPLCWSQVFFFTTGFPQVKQIDSGNVACDLILFCTFFQVGHVTVKVSKHLPSVPFIQQNGSECFRSFELHYQPDSKGIKWFYYFFNDHKTCHNGNHLV